MVTVRARRISRLRAAVAAPAAVLAGCRGAQSALDPQGPVAAALAELWWVLLLVCSLAFALILSLVLYAVYRSHGRRARVDARVLIVGGGMLFPALSVVGLLVYATDVGRRIVAEPEQPALRIEVTGRQWWWEVHYPAVGAAPEVTTANELHLPVGVPVEVAVRSADVIHSFWIPALAGKIDLIPGRVNVTRFAAAAAGAFRGQCAEFCGAQHAHMAFGVVAQGRAEFAAWRQARAAPAAPPALGAGARAGFEAFIANGCAVCHRVRGAIPDSGRGDPETGIRGPDLTHLAARPTIAGRTLAYSRANVALWIRANDSLKPGNRMPDFATLPDEDVESIAAYLDTLR